MSYRKYLMADDVPPSELYKTVKIDTDSDTISRAKAIEALDKRFDSIPMEQTSEILMLRKDLRNLPPAQPEHIIHCKDCENHIYRDWCRMVQHTTSDYSDCARELNAKRKENDDE